LNSICKYFIEKFWVCVHQGNWSIIFFVVILSLSGFGTKVILAS
jgi:hypothetical protein